MGCGQGFFADHIKTIFNNFFAMGKCKKLGVKTETTSMRSSLEALLLLQLDLQKCRKRDLKVLLYGLQNFYFLGIGVKTSSYNLISIKHIEAMR